MVFPYVNLTGWRGGGSSPISSVAGLSKLFLLSYQGVVYYRSFRSFTNNSVDQKNVIGYFLNQ